MKNNVITDISDLDLSRIAIIGCPGSGKTTFSDKLGKALGREVIHLDRVLWDKNWQMLPYDDRKKIHDGLISCDRWIIDGMWKSHLVERFTRATTVFFLDYKRSVCVARALKRRIKYNGKQRDDIAEGCLEKLDGYFMRYIWTFNKQVRPVILQLISLNPQVKCVMFANSKQMKRFLLSATNSK